MMLYKHNYKPNLNAANAVIAGRIPSAVIGPNKRLVRDDEGLHGVLNGHKIVTKTKTRLILTHYGHQRPGMREAMKQFLHLLNIPGNVSFAGGRFVVTINGCEHEGEGRVEVEI